MCPEINRCAKVHILFHMQWPRRYWYLAIYYILTVLILFNPPLLLLVTIQRSNMIDNQLLETTCHIYTTWTALDNNLYCRTVSDEPFLQMRFSLARLSRSMRAPSRQFLPHYLRQENATIYRLKNRLFSTKKTFGGNKRKQSDFYNSLSIKML